MIVKTISLAILGSLMLIGCKKSIDGEYLAYKTDVNANMITKIHPMYNRSEQIENQLRNIFAGKHYVMVVKGKYAQLSLMSKSHYSDLTLESRTTEGIYHYYFKKPIGNIMLEFRLLPYNDKDSINWLLAVDCVVDSDLPLVVPAQFGAALESKSLPQARIICYLSKVD